MSRSKFLAISLIFSLGVGGAAYAAPAFITAPVTAVSMGWGGDGAYLTILGTDTSQGCSVTNQLVIPSTVAGYKENLAVLLTAMTSGLTEQIWVNGCYNGRPIVIGMGMAL